MCDKATLIEWAGLRDNNASPDFILLEATKALVDTIKIDTANRTPEDVVDELLAFNHTGQPGSSL